MGVSIDVTLSSGSSGSDLCFAHAVMRVVRGEERRIVVRADGDGDFYCADCMNKIPLPYDVVEATLDAKFAKKDTWVLPHDKDRDLERDIKAQEDGA